MAALTLCIACLLPTAAQAEVQTIDFESGALNAPLNGQGDISFPLGLGFRPYRTDVGTHAHSGTGVGDLGRCSEETVAAGGNPGECEFFQAGTTALLTRTAKAVSVFAGRFGPDPAFAVLTAFDSEGDTVATTGPLPITETFNRNLVVQSNAGDIAGFAVEARIGPNGETKGAAEDLGIDDVSVNFADGGEPDFSITTTRDVVALVQGQHVDVPVRITRLNGSSGRIELSATDLPEGVSADPVFVEGTNSTATVRLSADPNAPDTNFVPTEAKITARPFGATAGQRSHSARLLVRVASELELSAGGVSENDPRKVLVTASDCAAVDVPVRIRRDIAMNRDVTLSVQGEDGGPGLPAGVSAQILPSSVVPPGGGLIAERTLRLSANGDSFFSQKPIPLVLEATAGPGGRPHLLQIEMVHLAGAKLATTRPGSNLGFTPRFLKDGSTAEVHGLGFCPGTKIEVGNERAVVPATFVDDHTLTFNVPRYATSSGVRIIPPGHFSRYSTEDDLRVDSVRNSDAFPFQNYGFGHLSLDEFVRAFGAEEVFLSVNLCWPWGSCRVPTNIVDPLAALDWGWMNVALPYGDGHCFGIDVAVQRLRSGKVPYREVADPGHANARSAFELSDVNGPGDSLNSYLDSEHAKQFADEVLAARFRRSHSIQDQLDVLERELGRNREPMVGLIKSVADGHIVLAYDMVQTADSAEIYVYENERPFAAEEEIDPALHQGAVGQGVIRVDKTTNSWFYPIPRSKEVWKGSGDDGSLWAVPTNTVPEDPSLPGLDTLTSLVTSTLSSASGSVQGRASASARPVPSESAGAGGQTRTWIAGNTKRPLQVTFTGTEAGHYTQAFTAPRFVASVAGVPTAKGVRDTVRGSADSIVFESGTDRQLKIALAQQSGSSLTVAATLDTHASADGAEKAGFSDDGGLIYAHEGKATALEFSLTSIRRKGGPSTFVSGPVAVRPGDRLRVKPVGRDLRRVRLRIRAANGKTRVRMLRSRGGRPGHVRLGAPKVSKRRLSMPLKISGFHGRAMVGAVLRLMRGNRVVARKAVAVKATNRKGKITWHLPRGAKKGRYRLRVDLRAASTGARGSTVTGSVTVHRTATVRL